MRCKKYSIPVLLVNVCCSVLRALHYVVANIISCCQERALEDGEKKENLVGGYSLSANRWADGVG